MTEVKWFARIEAQQEEDKATARLGPPGPLPRFDLTVLGQDTRARRLAVWFLNRFFLCYFWLARKTWPFPPLPKFWKVVCVTRAADVEKVLSDYETFEVPYGPEMKELAGGANFVLGLDGPGQVRQSEIIQQVMREGDRGWLEDLTQRFANALILASGGTIDVMSDLVTRVATETCGRYFGLDILEPDAFAEWAMSLSTLLFADPGGDTETRKLALNGAARVRAIVDRAIGKSKTNPGRGDSTLVDRLVASQHASGTSDEEMRAILVGMVVGFIPTTTLAAARMLEELMRRPKVMKEAMAAASENRKSDLKAILWEAARLNPALQPGQWRYASRNVVIGKGFWRKKVKAGTVLLVSTQSALRDVKNPNRFQINRTPHPTFMFGDGRHYCLGTQIAMMQITEVFIVLMAQRNLRPAKGFAGGIAWIGPLPRRLDMRFDHAAAPANQSMITVFAPVTGPISTNALNDLIRPLGNPSPRDSTISRALDATRIVHFASMAVIESGDPAKPSRHLLLELNVDGSEKAAFDAVVAHAGSCLEPIFRAAIPGCEPLEKLLRRYALRLRPFRRTASGYNFDGTPEFPVIEIERHAALASFSRRALDHYLKQQGGLGARPWGALDHVRKLINQDGEFYREARRLEENGQRQEGAELAQLLRDGACFEGDLIWPSRRRLQFADWADPGSWTPLEQVRDFFAAGGGRTAGLILIISGVAFTLLNLAYLNARTWISFASFLASLVISLVCAVVMEAMIVAGFVGGFLWLLRRKEASDAVVDKTPALADIKQSAASENPSGYAQNHFMAVTSMKPGWFRKVTLALALSVVALMVRIRFRKGFVLNMGTIHYAKWFRGPGTDKLIFLSNYDGSWESYLEDFVMRAHTGQTAVWSNGEGFPSTAFLIKGGAQDGDRFKRWVRCQQQIAPFWFSRFPGLTTTQIRNNALIHYGLARARNAAAARPWLRCFGSLQRPDDAIESEDVQSLVFTTFSDLPYAACLVVRIPEQLEDRRRWLRGIMPRATGPGPNIQPLCFGDVPSGGAGREGAAIATFSAGGLKKFGVPPATGADGLATFSGVFNMGMGERGGTLGDAPVQQNGGEWSDREAEAVLFVYGRRPEIRERLIQGHIEWLRHCNGDMIATIPTDPVHQRGDQGEYRSEHFGFRDGISQPIIRGTQRFSLQPLARDVVEPGEFIFGYPNNLGYFPPSPTVRAESDPGRNLSIPMPSSEAGANSATTSNFPDFDALDRPNLPRDFGRNGTYLVLRQLVQDVDGFARFTSDKAREVNDKYGRLLRVAGGPVDANWIAAKLVGRWRDGTPLIDRSGAASPTVGPNRGMTRYAPDDVQGGDMARTRGQTRRPAAPGLEVPDNDFAYGQDDPTGLQCPLGAHVRRANPRDSLQPGDAEEQGITNRHRLLRRGRSYEQNGEKGLLFVALCADLERQFEFLQQTWVNSSSFHGLTHEADPIAASGGSADRVFTIPTASGPMILRDMRNFVTFKAGGYFFLPSRSALEYLIELHPPAP